MKLTVLGVLVGLFVSSDSDELLKMKENTFAMRDSGKGELIMMDPQAVNVMIGEKLTRIVAKGTETAYRIKQGENIELFARGKAKKSTKGKGEKVEITVSLLHMEVTKSKRIAQYNKVANEEIKSITLTPRQVYSEQMIYKLLPAQELKPGVYCLIFREIKDGNLVDQEKLEANATIFEVLE